MMLFHLLPNNNAWKGGAWGEATTVGKETVGSGTKTQEKNYGEK